jgi:hypothetical protein
MYRVSLKPSYGSRMTIELPAENKSRAKLYVQNRWPRSIVGSIELVKQ